MIKLNHLGVAVIMILIASFILSATTAFAATTDSYWPKKNNEGIQPTMEFPKNTERALITGKKSTARDNCSAILDGGTASSLYFNVKYNGADRGTTVKGAKGVRAYIYIDTKWAPDYGKGYSQSLVARQTVASKVTGRGRGRLN